MIVVTDVETGGTKPGKAPLLSISAVLLDRPEKTFTVFINPEPGQVVEEEAAEINGYTPEKWKDLGAVSLAVGLRLFKSWLPPSGNAPLAHNAPFDKAMLEAAEEKAEFPLYLKKRWRCSMYTFMAVNDALGLNVPDFKLETLARMCGHWSPDFIRGEHQSLDDVLACAAGWRWLIAKIREGARS